MAITVDDMPVAFKHLKEHGVKITREPISLGKPYGVSSKITIGSLSRLGNGSLINF